MNLGNRSREISGASNPKCEKKVKIIMAGKRDTSKDGLGNKIQTLVLTNFKGIWQLLQSNKSIARKVNKTLT